MVVMLLAFTVVHAGDNRTFKTITAASGLSDNSVQTIESTRSSRMIITTTGDFNFYDGARFMPLSPEGKTVFELSNYMGNDHLVFDHHHHIWLKRKHSVTCVDLITERYIANVDSVFVNTFGMEDPVLDIFPDQNGEVWLMGKGYVTCNKYGYKVPVDDDLNLQDLEIYDQSYLVLFYEDGSIACYDVGTGQELYRSMAYGKQDAEIYRSSTVQVGREGGFYQIRNGGGKSVLMHFDFKTQTWTEIMRPSGITLNNMIVYNNDGKEELYVVSSQGYFVMDLETGDIRHTPTLTMRNGMELETGINDIAFDRQGGMWLATQERGLLYARKLTAIFTTLPWTSELALKYDNMMADLTGISRYNDQPANVKYEDSRGWTWVGTPSGLTLFRPNQKPVTYGRKDGFLNNVVHTVIEDDYKNIWVGTSYGISCLQYEGDSLNRVFSFNEEDNVPNEMFVDGKMMKLEDGTIVMKAIDHILTFQPEEFQKLFHRAPVLMYPKLTKLLVNGVVIEAGQELDGKVLMNEAITRVTEVDLNYDQNTVTLTFSAMNYARPLYTCYKVRIRELDNEWHEYTCFEKQGFVDRQGVLHLPLTGLRPGSYHIELQCTWVEGKYLGEPLVWTINIHEPWWRRAGVFRIVALVILILALYNFYLYNRNTRMRERRTGDEGEVMKRVTLFVERCEGLGSATLAPTSDELYGSGMDMRNEMSDEFMEMMLKLLPYIRGQEKMPSMSEMSVAVGMDVQEFYQLMMSNFYKNPRALVRTMRLEEAATKLRQSGADVEQVARDCGFATPNYFIASFYHRYKQTPRDYAKNYHIQSQFSQFLKKGSGSAAG